MKFVLVFAVVMIAFYIWRNNRREERNEAAQTARTQARTKLAGPEEMISCAQCGLHLPRSDAVVGASGALYCGQEHRLAAEH